MKNKRRPTAFIVLLLVVMTLLIYHGAVFRPGVVYGKDTIEQGYPLAWFESKALAKGKTVGWFPHMMSGFPMILPHPFYPTDWLLLLMPITRAITWRYILHTFAAAGLMYLLMRRFQRSVTGSIVAGMAFGFSAFFISKVYAGHGAALWSGTWIPLTLLLLDQAIETRKIRYAILTGGAFGLQILGQHPQYAYYTALAVGLFAVWRIIPILVRKRKPKLTAVYFGLALLAILFAVMVSAPFLLPFAQASSLSNRADGTNYQFASSFSLHPAQLITALSPSFCGNPVRQNSVFGALYWDGAMFIGVIPFILAVIAFRGARDSRANYFKVLAVLSIIIALGSHTPFFKLAYHIPGLDMMRAPSKILFLYSLSMAALAGYGADILLSSGRRSVNQQDIRQGSRLAQRYFLYSTVGLALGLVLWTAAGGHLSSLAERTVQATRSNPEAVMAKISGLYSLQLKGLAWAAAFSAAGGLIALGITRQKPGASIASTALISLCFLDLWMYADPLLFTTNPRTAYTSGDRMAIKIMKADTDPFRVLPLDTDAFRYAQGVFDDLESVNGYYPLPLARYSTYTAAIDGLSAGAGDHTDIKNYNSPLVGLLNVKYVLSSTPIQSSELVEVHSGEAYVYYNNNYLPRAFTVHRAKIVKTSDDALAEVTKDGFDPRAVVVLETNESLPPTSGDASFDRVSIRSMTDNEINIAVNMTSDGCLVVSEVYYPAWQAWVDGKPTRILPADYLFRAVYVPEGRHEVKMAYVNTPYRAGAFLALVSAAFIVGLLVFGRGRTTSGCP